MKNMHILSAVLLTMFIVGVAYLSFWIGLDDRPTSLAVKPLDQVVVKKAEINVNLDNSL